MAFSLPTCFTAIWSSEPPYQRRLDAVELLARHDAAIGQGARGLATSYIERKERGNKVSRDCARGGTAGHPVS